MMLLRAIKKCQIRNYSQLTYNISREYNKWDVETVTYEPINRNSKKNKPLIFVHGEWTNPWIWQEHMMPWFSDKGYTCKALNFDSIVKSPLNQRRGVGTLDYLNALKSLIEEGGIKNPIMIGHGLGNLFIQKYLFDHSAMMAVFLSPYPPLVNKDDLEIIHNRLKNTIEFAETLRSYGRDSHLHLLSSYPVAKKFYFSPNLDEATLEKYHDKIAVLKSSKYLLYELNRKFLFPPKLSDDNNLKCYDKMLIFGSEDKLITRKDYLFIRDYFGMQMSQLYMFDKMGHASPIDSNWKSVCELIHDRIEIVEKVYDKVMEDDMIQTKREQSSTKKDRKRAEGLKSSVSTSSLLSSNKNEVVWDNYSIDGGLEFVRSMLVNKGTRKVAQIGNLSSTRTKNILFVHSEWTGCWIWKETMEILTQKGYCCNSFSFSGHGNSRKYLEKDPIIEDFLNDLELAVDHLLKISNKSEGKDVQKENTTNNENNKNISDNNNNDSNINSDNNSKIIIVSHGISFQLIADWISRKPEYKSSIELVVAVSPYTHMDNVADMNKVNFLRILAGQTPLSSLNDERRLMHHFFSESEIPEDARTTTYFKFMKGKTLSKSSIRNACIRGLLDEDFVVKNFENFDVNVNILYSLDDKMVTEEIVKNLINRIGGGGKGRITNNQNIRILERSSSSNNNDRSVVVVPHMMMSNASIFTHELHKIIQQNTTTTTSK
eukprot:TRINITY_DN8107_c0_g1_i1.p1 TRINITY_DN8107_c0_g1~~TRINITY_DN8107_c0_g1_i1.p1  ORF type:complete len:713 (+),score=145.42 TRINITY_DN8107_c0_g1_i1:40-2178(+)